jgi:hypothetical protein
VGAYEAIGELRARIRAFGARTGAPAGPPVAAAAAVESAARAASAPQMEASPCPAPTVEPERFDAALTRLRDTTPPPSVEADAAQPAWAAPEPRVAWLPKVFRQLARTDPVLAGRLVLELLPAQRLVHPEPIAYDLVLSDQTCVQVTVAEAGLQLELADTRRPREAIQFAVVGDQERLARLLTAGRVRRRLRRGLPTVVGKRHGMSAIEALVAAPLSLRELHDSDVRLKPTLALHVVAQMIDRRWISGAGFVIAYERPDNAGPIYLMIAAGEPPVVSETPPSGSVSATIECAPEVLMPLLDSAIVDARIHGESDKVAVLQSWVKRAQTG